MRLSISEIFGFTNLEREELVRRNSLIRIILLTCFFGIPYSAVYVLIFDIWEGFLSTGTYILLSMLNLGYFYFTKKYNFFRTTQLILIIFLPLSVQIAIGGFMSSSAVGITALLAPVGALMFHNVKTARRIFYIYTVALVGSGVIEYFFLESRSVVSREVQIMFFVFILFAASIIIYLLLEYVVIENNDSKAIIIVQNKALVEKQDAITATNEELQQQKEELSMLLELTQNQNEIIKKNSEEVKSSIAYASRIQRALLPVEHKVEEYFEGQVFTLYRPRDIVSGDFYWCEKVGATVIIAVGDCTGHGVPGAFMSMLAISGLNSIVFQEKIIQPEKVLNRLHEYIYTALKQDRRASLDGMDMVILCINKELNSITCAGAMNPVYYVQNGQLHEIKGDKKPIGGEQYGRDRNYSNHLISIDIPTTVYLCTDGFQDQFGGSGNEKFMKRRFKELLLGIHTLPLEEQENRLEQTLYNWMEIGGEKQIDDVLVVGIKL